MADERMSDGEIRARFESVNSRFDSVDKRLDRMAPLDTVASETGRLRDQIAGLDRDCRERADDSETAVDKRFRQLEDRGQITWGRVVAVLTLVLSLLGVVWTVYSSSKGVK